MFGALEKLLSLLSANIIGWSIGCFGFNGSLRQYFSLYRAVSQREGKRKEKRYMTVKLSKISPRAFGPCATFIQISRTPRHWKFTQDHPTVRPQTQQKICAFGYKVVKHLTS